MGGGEQAPAPDGKVRYAANATIGEIHDASCQFWRCIVLIDYLRHVIGDVESEPNTR